MQPFKIFDFNTEQPIKIKDFKAKQPIKIKDFKAEQPVVPHRFKNSKSFLPVVSCFTPVRSTGKSRLFHTGSSFLCQYSVLVWVPVLQTTSLSKILQFFKKLWLLPKSCFKLKKLWFFKNKILIGKLLKTSTECKIFDFKQQENLRFF